MKRIALLTVLLAVLMGLQLASAGNLDKYREMLNNRSCTIKYEFIYQDERETYKDDMDLRVMKMQEKYEASAPRTFAGVIVLKGDASYIEKGEYGMHYCEITKNGYVYPYRRYDTDKGIQYVGNRGGGFFGGTLDKVEGHPINSLSLLRYGQYYGDDEITEMMRVIRPETEALRPGKIYWLAGSATLPNGIICEDYQWAGANGDVDLIRYYFDNGNLVKIASVHYVKLADGRVKGKHYVVRVDEFSNVPDEGYLNLPDKLKDATKYGEGKAK